MPVGPAGEAPQSATQQQPRELRVVRNCNARHRRVRPFSACGAEFATHRTITKRLTNGQLADSPLIRLLFYQPRGVETIDSGTLWIAIGEVARQRPQVAVCGEQVGQAKNF